MTGSIRAALCGQTWFAAAPAIVDIGQHIDAAAITIVGAGATATSPLETRFTSLTAAATCAAVARIPHEIGARAVAINLARRTRTGTTRTSLLGRATDTTTAAVLVIVQRVDARAIAVDVPHGTSAFTAQTPLPKSAGVTTAATVLRIVEEGGTTPVAERLEWPATFVADTAPAHQIVSTPIPARAAVVSITRQITTAIVAVGFACTARAVTRDAPKTFAAAATTGTTILRVAQQVRTALRAQNERLRAAATHGVIAGRHALTGALQEARFAAALAGIAHGIGLTRIAAATAVVRIYVRVRAPPETPDLAVTASELTLAADTTKAVPAGVTAGATVTCVITEIHASGAAADLVVRATRMRVCTGATDAVVALRAIVIAQTLSGTRAPTTPDDESHR